MSGRIFKTPWGAALVHLVVAVTQQMRWRLLGVHHGFDEWANFWQGMNPLDMADDFWRSLWHLHAQPPGYQLWGWVWFHLSGPDRFATDMLWGYVAMGALMAAMTWSLAFALTRSRGWATAAGLLMACNPSVIHFENYYLYDLPAAFLLMTSAWALWKALSGRSARYGVLFLAAVALLTLTRSAFHLVFLLAALPFAWPALRAVRARARVAILVLAIVPTVGWYAKNEVQYGFFGASSWYGFGFYKCYVDGNRERNHLVDEEYHAGLISEMAYNHRPYDSYISAYRAYGFDRTSDIPSLSRDDLHNINVPDLAKIFGQTATRLAIARPGRYLVAVHGSYCRFSRPVSEFVHLVRHDIYRSLPWEEPLDKFVLGTKFTDEVEMLTRLDLGSLLYFAFPSLLLFAALWVWRRRGALWGCVARQSEQAGRATDAAAEGAAVMLMLWFLVASVYTVLVSCMFEFGENNRFRLPIEGFNLVMVLVALRSLWLWQQRRKRALRVDRSETPASEQCTASQQWPVAGEQ